MLSRTDRGCLWSVCVCVWHYWVGAEVGLFTILGCSELWEADWPNTPNELLLSSLPHTHTRSHTHTSPIHSTLKHHCSHWGSLFPKAPSQTLLISYILLLFQRVRVHVRVVVRAARADVSSPRVHHSFNTSQQVRLRNSWIKEGGIGVAAHFHWFIHLWPCSP